MDIYISLENDFEDVLLLRVIPELHLIEIWIE